MYENSYGFSSVDVTLPKYSEETTDKSSDPFEPKSDDSMDDDVKKITNSKRNVGYRHLMLKLRGKNIHEERTERFFVANGSQADETAFNEFIKKMDLTGDPQLIIQQPDSKWHGLQNQTNLDGYDNKFANK